MELTTAIFFALIFAASPGAPRELLGQRVEVGQPVPNLARGLLFPEVGVAQLAEGARAELLDGGAPGLRLRAGGVRVVAQRSLVVEVDGGLLLVVSSESEALVTTRAGVVTLCAVEGRAEVSGLPPVVAQASGEESLPVSAGAPGDGDRRLLAPGSCLTLETSPPGLRVLEESPVDPVAAAGLRRLSEPAPAPAELPDLVGDLDAQRSGVESQWSEAFEQGPRREAQSCGCSEGGGSSGGLDPNGSTQPTPRPEAPGAGTLRVRVALPVPARR